MVMLVPWQRSTASAALYDDDLTSITDAGHAHDTVASKTQVKRQHAIYKCMSRLCYKHHVCLSVCLSVTLVDCDHIVQQSGTLGRGVQYHRSVSWLRAASRSRPGSY